MGMAGLCRQVALQSEGLLPPLWSFVAARRAYNPLGSTVTFLSECQVSEAVTHLLGQVARAAKPSPTRKQETVEPKNYPAGTIEPPPPGEVLEKPRKPKHYPNGAMEPSPPVSE
jgi:hypothetical protein